MQIHVAPVFAPDYSAIVLAAKMCFLTPMSILCIFDFYDIIGSYFSLLVVLELGFILNQGKFKDIYGMNIKSVQKRKGSSIHLTSKQSCVEQS